MVNGYEVAADDLRTFAQILSQQAGEYGELKEKAEGGKLDFQSPMVAMLFKSSFNDAAQTVIDALNAFSGELEAAGTGLTTVADNYEEQERSTADAAAALQQQTSGVNGP